MVAQAGRDLLIRVNTSGSNYANVGGMRNASVDVSTNMVDVTNADSAGRWREILGGAGINTMKFSGSGVFSSDPALKSVIQTVMTGAIKNYQVVVAGLGTFEGNFLAQSVVFSGTYNAEEQYNMTFESAGPITFTAA